MKAPLLSTARNDAALLGQLRDLVGGKHVVTGDERTRAFRRGYRAGEGPCLAVVRPGSLVEMWRCLEACVAAGMIVILQAANTGLTGGSTPSEGCDRPIVVLSTLRLTGIRVLGGGDQVVCLPGATLDTLERKLKPLGREPHSVIGSSCIGASVIGGVCNNSGGALVRRGPAYTELALYARLSPEGRLELVNHLGLDLGEDPETILRRLDQADMSLDALVAPTTRRASDGDYAAHVRDVEAVTPARFNADPRRLFEAAGSAGKIAVFAVRLDTFAPEPDTTTFYVGSNDPADLTALRRRILQDAEALPIAGEYMHREAFDIAARYGKDMFLAISWLGADQLPRLNRFKNGLDTLARRVGLPSGASDRLLQALGGLFPAHLPAKITAFRNRYEHHLLIKVGGADAPEMHRLLKETFASTQGDYFVCSPDEAKKAFLHRFVTAGAAIRYWAIHPDEVEDILALDIALQRRDRHWLEVLPEHLERQILHKLYYGHFFCHVFHQDYLVRKGCDVQALDHAMLALLDGRGAEYPAEHNVGHLYAAKPALERHYRALDPLNAFNPGIGGLSKRQRWT